MTSDDLRSWDALADGWSEWVHHNDNRLYVLDPAHLQKIGDVTGKRVLDAGCGEGRFARMLAERGAKVTAFDFSPRMIELATQNENGQAAWHRVCRRRHDRPLAVRRRNL